MEKIALPALFSLVLLAACAPYSHFADTPSEGSTIADHRVMTELYRQQIPASAIGQAAATLHIGYGHTSHGSQITDGMDGLVAFANANWSYAPNRFAWSQDGSAGLHLYEGDGYGTGDLDHDAGYYPNWVNETEAFLSGHSGYNVIMWSWCGQLSGYTEAQVWDNYLDEMSALEAKYPHITFIYMTGHLWDGAPGDSAEGVLERNNEIIRDYCRTNRKWLFDFADIEKYDLDLTYFGNKHPSDACAYDSDGDGSRDANWALDWQNAHNQGTDWYSCGSQHSQPVNANQKAYAAWWLFARIAGWD